MLKILNVAILVSFLSGCADNKIIETTYIIERPLNIRHSKIVIDGEVSRLGHSINNSQHCEPYPHPDSDLYKAEARIRKDLSQIGVSEDAIRREILKTRSAVCGN